MSKEILRIGSEVTGEDGRKRWAQAEIFEDFNDSGRFVTWWSGEIVSEPRRPGDWHGISECDHYHRSAEAALRCAEKRLHADDSL